VECALSPRNLLRALALVEILRPLEKLYHRDVTAARRKTRERERERERDREGEGGRAEGIGTKAVGMWKKRQGGEGGGPRTLCHLSLTAAYFRRWFPSQGDREYQDASKLRFTLPSPPLHPLHLTHPPISPASFHSLPTLPVPSRTIAVTSSACNSVALPP